MKHLNIASCVGMIAALLFLPSVLAFETQEKENKIESNIPRIEKGDNIYLRIGPCRMERLESGEGNQPIRKVPVDQPIVTVYEFHDGTWQSLNITGDNEFLVRYHPEYAYQIDIQKTKKDKQEHFHKLSVEAIMAGIRKNMQENPTDRSRWTTTLERGKDHLTLVFAGIQRLYKLDSVEIPKDSSHRSNAQYKNSANTPIMCVCVDHKGIPMRKKGFKSEGIRSKSKGWQANFPETEENIWEIREGIQSKYLIRLRDVNTRFSEVSLLDVAVDGEDFRDAIYEKIGPDEDKTTAVVFRFSLIDD